MTQILSITVLRQKPSRSWFWAPRRRADAAPAKAPAAPPPASREPIEVKQANWPRQRAAWMPPLT